MRKHSRLVAQIFMLIIFVGSLLPACGSPAGNKTPHDQDDALLLQISSHVRLSGEPDLGSYAVILPAVHKASYIRPAVAPATKTEVDILVDLYTTYASRLHSQGNLTDSNIDRMVKSLDTKIKRLNERSQQLEKRRRRRGRGLARFFRRVGRGIGRFARQLGRGIGKAAEYLIKEVAPEVIRDMVLTGQPLTAKIFWKGVRKVVRSRLKRAVGLNLAKQGVPPEILAEAGLDLELEEEQEPITEDQPVEPEEEQEQVTEDQPAEPEDEVEVLPVISASGTFSETLSGAVNTSRPMGVDFQLQANYVTGKINGNLTGGRTTSGNPFECVSNEDPSIVYDTAFVDYTDSYTASFSGTIDPETGDFSIKIIPKGSTTDRITTPFTVEGCLHLNSQPAPGSSGWTGDGTISGYVTKDGFIDLKTYWTSFGGQIEVAGSWSGPGTIETP
jgi:hypothetical protein